MRAADADTYSAATMGVGLGEITGTWVGTLTIPNVAELRMGITLVRGPEGALEALLRIIDQATQTINGDRDMQNAPKMNLLPIETALRESRHPDFEVRELPGLNHLFQHAETGLEHEYARIEETMAPEMPALIADWILAKLAAFDGIQ